MYARIGKNIVYIGFGTIWGFRHPLGVLEHIPTDSAGYCMAFSFLVLELFLLGYLCKFYVYHTCFAIDVSINPLYSSCSSTVVIIQIKLETVLPASVKMQAGTRRP